MYKVFIELIIRLKLAWPRVWEKGSWGRQSLHLAAQIGLLPVHVEYYINLLYVFNRKVSSKILNIEKVSFDYRNHFQPDWRELFQI